MEEDQKTQGVLQDQVTPESTAAPEKPAERVNFSSIPVRSTKPKSSAKILLGIFILIIFVVGGFLIFKDSSEDEAIVEETPTPDVTISTPTPTATSAPVDKSKILIDIQNGTGIAGEAAFLRDALKELGYSDFKLGNATSTDNVTTTVTYNKNTPQSVQDEITDELKSLYKEVSVKTSSTQVSSVVIVTGLQKNATAKPAATSTAKPTTKPTASPSSSPSASPSATPTPTP